MIKLISIMFFLSTLAGWIMYNPNDVISTAPTETNASLIRGSVGAFGAPRVGGRIHNGVDIVANQSNLNKDIYKVKAVSNGKIAYARINGSATDGLGYTVVIDHGNDYYTLYAHLAHNVSKGLVSIGEEVMEGQVIGYMADLQNNEKSSGNVLHEVVAPFDKIMLHFEVFKSKSGRRSTGQLAPLKEGGDKLDPTEGLNQHGYNSF